MKIFVYKTLFIFLCVFLLFQLTFGIKIKQLNNELEKFKSQKNIENMKNKLRDELRNAISKENYLSPEDAKLINDFINKLQKELSNSN
jgi:protein-arginine kinase activator protein McsA